jgi:hypothetical protein
MEGTMNPRIGILVLCGSLIGALTLVGCADKPKPQPQPSSSQVKSESDRFFDKMKQDEREQGKGMAPAR